MTMNRTVRHLRADVLAPIAIALVILALSAVLFVYQRSSIEDRLAEETRLVGTTFSAHLETELNSRLRAGRLLGRRFLAEQGFDAEFFRREAELTHALYEDFQAINWVDAEGVIRIVTPEEGNAAAMGLDLRGLPLPAATLARAEATGLLQVTPPIELAQGGRGFTAYVPINGTSNRSGFINMVFRSDLLFQRLLEDGMNESYALRVTDEGAIVHELAQRATRPDLGFARDVDVGNRRWHVTVVPTEALVRQAATWLDETILAFGVLAAVLSGVTSRLAFLRQRTAREGQARLRDIADNIDDVVWVSSADFRETRYVNPAFTRIFGLGLERLRSDPRAFAKALAPEEAQKLEATTSAVLQAMAAGDDAQASRFEYPIYRVTGPDGITRSMYARSIAMRDAQGRIDRFVGIATDVTELLQAQEDLRQSNERLLQSQKMEAIGQLTGGVAHDFNNLLAVILGNIELVEESGVSGETKQFLGAARAATLRGADLTKSLLSFARQSSLEPVRVNLNDLVRETQAWSSRVIAENIEVEVSLLARLWPVEADPGLTQNALLNLILNAQDAMPRGGKLTIETSNQRIDEEYRRATGEDIDPGRYVLLAVTDTGTGIPREIVSQVFDPFFTTKPVGAGSGLGLSMVQGFMNQSGGMVRIYSEPGVGTTVKLYFKAARGDRDSSVGAPPASQQIAAEGARVLVVEDEAAVLDVLVNSLTRAGYQITSARSGDAALKIWENDSGFDLLLTDIVMPGRLQGTHLAKELRARDPDLPVIFLSGYAREATVHGNGLRPEDIRLMKPVSRTDLVSAVEQALAPGRDPKP